MDRNSNSREIEVTDNSKLVLDFLIELADHRTDRALEMCCLIVAGILLEDPEHATQNLETFNINVESFIKDYGTVH